MEKKKSIVAAFRDYLVSSFCFFLCYTGRCASHFYTLFYFGVLINFRVTVNNALKIYCTNTAGADTEFLMISCFTYFLLL